MTTGSLARGESHLPPRHHLDMKNNSTQSLESFVSHTFTARSQHQRHVCVLPVTARSGTLPSCSQSLQSMLTANTTPTTQQPPQNWVLHPCLGQLQQVLLQTSPAPQRRSMKLHLKTACPQKLHIMEETGSHR